jgi:hypothetical protein
MPAPSEQSLGAFFVHPSTKGLPMQTTVHLGRLKYLVRAPTDQRPTITRLYKENPNIPWEEVRSHLTPEAMLAERVRELTAYALKCTGRHRKARLYPDARVFPRVGLSALEYVKAFYALNQLGTPSHFAPLARHVTLAQGIDSEEEI